MLPLSNLAFCCQPTIAPSPALQLAVQATHAIAVFNKNKLLSLQFFFHCSLFPAVQQSAFVVDAIVGPSASSDRFQGLRLLRQDGKLTLDTCEMCPWPKNTGCERGTRTIWREGIPLSRSPLQATFTQLTFGRFRIVCATVSFPRSMR